MNFKPDQLGVVCRDLEAFAEAQRIHRRTYGATFPVTDTFTAVGMDFRRTPIKQTVRCLFDRGVVEGLEFVLMCYVFGWNLHWLYSHPGNAWVAHLGQHVEKESDIDYWRDKHKVLQETVTTEHSNTKTRELARRYHLVVFDTRAYLGHNMQLTRRLTIIESDQLKARFRADILRHRAQHAAKGPTA